MAFQPASPHRHVLGPHVGFGEQELAGAVLVEVGVHHRGLVVDSLTRTSRGRPWIASRIHMSSQKCTAFQYRAQHVRVVEVETRPAAKKLQLWQVAHNRMPSWCLGVGEDDACRRTCLSSPTEVAWAKFGQAPRGLEPRGAVEGFTMARVTTCKPASRSRPSRLPVGDAPKWSAMSRLSSRAAGCNETTPDGGRRGRGLLSGGAAAVLPPMFESVRLTCSW